MLDFGFVHYDVDVLPSVNILFRLGCALEGIQSSDVHFQECCKVVEFRKIGVSELLSPLPLCFIVQFFHCHKDEESVPLIDWFSFNF